MSIFISHALAFERILCSCLRRFESVFCRLFIIYVIQGDIVFIGVLFISAIYIYRKLNFGPANFYKDDDKLLGTLVFSYRAEYEGNTLNVEREIYPFISVYGGCKGC